MANINTELYFEPVSEGICEVLGCSHPAKYRASWAQGVIVKLMCITHKAEVEGKLFSELSPNLFRGKEERTSGQGLPPGARTPNHAIDDSELEWLLCLASSFQARQPPSGQEC
jgi:hypothetical protein